MQDEKEKGRVVYSRLEGAGEEEPARARKGAGGGFAAALLAHDSLWKALLPLFVGFALLVGLVFGLGYESVRKVKDARYSTSTSKTPKTRALTRSKGSTTTATSTSSCTPL